jgi:hypothetical protein
MTSQMPYQPHAGKVRIVRLWFGRGRAHRRLPAAALSDGAEPSLDIVSR